MIHLDYPFLYDTSIKLAVSLVLGASIGAEREYKGRNIGFRTIILITLGSTFFTIISFIIGDGSDPARVASNIVTGIGFLGAGAIFRDGVSVRGVTTASIIWISAAIGMACGIAQYELAVLVTITVLLILLGFAWVQQFIDRYNKEMVYNITIPNNLELKAEIESHIKSHGLKFSWLNYAKLDADLIIVYEVSGSDNNHNKLIEFLSTSDKIKSFTV
ncbi:MgtC/SapB family protein [Aurantibacillus circumpalustris]|uniref:MgtC/SapB family protein n=1 Tax=Aurantibacillus circumpalustris TaxID=3036359 RepID=UPI00295C01E4|nr:MgtC/SapB family protein [Aurantibacillus circumpalustris]